MTTAMQKNDEKEKNLLFIEALTDAIGEAGEVPLEEIRNELRADGIDLDASVNHLREFIKTCSMDAKRKALDVASEARRDLEIKDKSLIGKFAAYSREELLERIKGLMPAVNGRLSLAYRNLDGKNQEDLVSILEDLEAAKDLESGKDDEQP